MQEVWPLNETLVKKEKGCRTLEKVKMQRGETCESVDNLGEDLLTEIFGRVGAKSLASVSCACKAWKHAATKVLSLPQLVPALSQNPNLQTAVEEIMEKILSKPIRPSFALAFSGQRFILAEVATLLERYLSSKIPIVACFAQGIIGPDARTNQQIEVIWPLPNFLIRNADHHHQIIAAQSGLVVVLGSFPDLSVNIVPLRNSFVDEEIRAFEACLETLSSLSSNCPSQLDVILLSDPQVNIRHLLRSLEGSLHKDANVVGGLVAEHDEYSLFFRNHQMEYVDASHSDSKVQCSTSSNTFNQDISRRESSVRSDAIAIVFCRRKSDFNVSNRVLFQTAISCGLSPVGPIYKCVSVKTHKGKDKRESSTWFSCRRVGEQLVLGGNSLFGDLSNEVGDHMRNEAFYIGVLRKSGRSTSRRRRKQKRNTMFTMHEVQAADDEYLFVEGDGLRTGDLFCFYRADSESAKSSSKHSLAQVQNQLKFPLSSRNSSGTCLQIGTTTTTSRKEEGKVFGGLLFACAGRGESFFGESNVDSSCFFEAFPDAPLAGMYCLGEIGPPSVHPWEAENEDSKTSLNFYSSMFFTSYGS